MCSIVTRRRTDCSSCEGGKAHWEMGFIVCVCVRVCARVCVVLRCVSLSCEKGRNCGVTGVGLPKKDETQPSEKERITGKDL